MTPVRYNGRRPPPSRHPAGVALVALVAALMAAAVSCTGGSDLVAAYVVTGQIVEVQSSAIDVFTSLTIRDEAGTVWTFGEGRFPGFTPSHLLQHQAQQEPLTVTFVEEEDGTLRILSIDDARPVSP